MDRGDSSRLREGFVKQDDYESFEALSQENIERFLGSLGRDLSSGQTSSITTAPRPSHLQGHGTSDNMDVDVNHNRPRGEGVNDSKSRISTRSPAQSSTGTWQTIHSETDLVMDETQLLGTVEVATVRPVNKRLPSVKPLQIVKTPSFQTTSTKSDPVDRKSTELMSPSNDTFQGVDASWLVER